MLELPIRNCDYLSEETLKIMSAARVLGDGLGDDTMMEAGDLTRPLGDPPDVPVSWTSKVMRSNVGGMPRPEDVLADEFVTVRLDLEFLNGEDGEPVITIGHEVLEAMNGIWKQYMIVKMFGRNIAISVLSRRLRDMWKPKGAMYVMDLPRQFFMVRFEEEEEYMAALMGGPWKVFGNYLMVQAWTPNFDPTIEEIETTSVWVRLANIPINFYHKSILMGIARGLGKPIRVDLTTLQCERARFARICVEVNLKKPLKGTIFINGERYYVSYEGLSSICSKCGLYGHLVHSCPQERTDENQQMKKGNSGNDSPGDEGFIRVGTTSRRTEPSGTSMSFSAGGSRGNSDTHRRAMTKTKDSANIALSNSFGRLGEDLDFLESHRGNNINEENKENEVMSMAQGNMGLGGKAENQRGSMDKKTGKNKTLGATGTKPKLAKGNRPTRGLVFGPTKEEEEQSMNGKRLRVELRNLGRPWGSFAQEIPSSGDGDQVMQSWKEGLHLPMDAPMDENGDPNRQKPAEGTVVPRGLGESIQ